MKGPDRMRWMRIYIAALLLGLPLSISAGASESMTVAQAEALKAQAIKGSADAFHKLQSAAQDGVEEAQHYLGLMYSDGLGVPKDYAKALKWLRKAAEQGNGAAEYDLAYMYYEGQGVSKNHAKAMKFLRKAAEDGDASGQGELGNMYYYGQGVPKDYAKAFKWLRKAAEQGDGESQHLLAFLYVNGDGVTKDNSQAIKWVSLAKAKGIKGADEDASKIEAVAMPDQIDKGRYLAIKWWTAHSTSPKDTELGTKINYGAFYAKSQTGMKINKRYRFWACLSDVGNSEFVLQNANDLAEQMITSIRTDYLDKAELNSFLSKGKDYCGPMVAYMGADGSIEVVQLH